jgi:uncharacterized protein (TIGR03067 family)
VTSLLLALVLAAPAPRETDKKETPSLIGEWAAESGIRSGKPATLNGMGLIFSLDGTVTWKEAAQESKVKYKFDPAKDPPEIDIEFLGGAKKLLGIYKVEGNSLIICFSPSERPKKFESPAGAGSMLINFKRAKKE